MIIYISVFTCTICSFDKNNSWRITSLINLEEAYFKYSLHDPLRAY